MNGYYGAFDGWLNLNSRGDDIFTILNEEASMWAIATFQNSSTTGNDPYGALYAGIQRANLVLKNIDLVSFFWKSLCRICIFFFLKYLKKFTGEDIKA